MESGWGIGSVLASTATGSRISEFGAVGNGSGPRANPSTSGVSLGYDRTAELVVRAGGGESTGDSRGDGGGSCLVGREGPPPATARPEERRGDCARADVGSTTGREPEMAEDAARPVTDAGVLPPTRGPPRKSLRSLRKSFSDKLDPSWRADNACPPEGTYNQVGFNTLQLGQVPTQGRRPSRLPIWLEAMGRIASGHREYARPESEPLAGALTLPHRWASCSPQAFSPGSSEATPTP